MILEINSEAKPSRIFIIVVFICLENKNLQPDHRICVAQICIIHTSFYIKD